MLQQTPPLKPCVHSIFLRLELSRLYNVDDFVKPAFDVLLGPPLKDLSNIHVQKLGFRLYELLSLGNDSLHSYHLSIAFQDPALDFENDTSWIGCANSRMHG